MKFDKSTQEYYLEVDDVINNRPITEDELADHFEEKSDQWLKHLSRQVYNLMYDEHRQGDRMLHNECIKWQIYTNDHAKEQYKQAVLEHVMGSYVAGKDLQRYVEDKEHWPSDVRKHLRNANLLIRGQLYCNPEWPK